MSDLTRPPRPIYRNIHISQIVAYRLPPAGIVSILHRVSGAVMFLSLPLVLHLFDKSLTSQISFEMFKSVTSNWLTKLFLLALIGAFTYHFASGIRHLAMDLHVGVEKIKGRHSAIAVLIVSGVLWFAFALKLFGAF